MKKLSLILIFLISVTTVNSTEIANNISLKTANENLTQVNMSDDETHPQFPGGDAELIKYIQNNIKYPEEAKNKGIQGRVIVQFTVKTDGSISDVQIIKPIEKSLDIEALRIISGMPCWQPATSDGHPIEKRFAIPVTFQLEENKNLNSADINNSKKADNSDNRIAERQEIVEKAPNSENVIEPKHATKGSKVVENHEAVDLGLSVLWATCNVEADSPDDFGGYYAWGEIEQKHEYSRATYKCLHEWKNKYYLDLKADVAHMKWGGNWRMPTHIETEELIDNCSWEWVIVNGVKGYKITAKNGNSIFLPAAGCRIDDGERRVGVGYYWTSAYMGSFLNPLIFRSSYIDIGEAHDMYLLNRTIGLTVRPVNGPSNVPSIEVEYNETEEKSERSGKYTRSWERDYSNDAPLPMMICNMCGGTGKVAIGGGGLILGYQTCPTCMGTGTVQTFFMW